MEEHPDKSPHAPRQKSQLQSILPRMPAAVQRPGSQVTLRARKVETVANLCISYLKNIFLAEF